MHCSVGLKIHATRSSDKLLYTRSIIFCLFHPEPRSVLACSIRENDPEALEEQTHIRIHRKVRLEPHPLDWPSGLSGGPGCGRQRIMVRIGSKSDARERLQQSNEE